MPKRKNGKDLPCFDLKKKQPEKVSSKQFLL